MNNTPNKMASRFIQSLCLAGCLAISAPAAANQNKVLAKFEAASANWSAPTISTELFGATETELPAAALGELVTLSVESTEPSAFLTAVINTYGDVRLLKSDDLSGSADFEFTTSTPPGQYSVFSFATSPAIPNNKLGIPDGATSHQMGIGVQGAEALLASIEAMSATHRIAKAAEFQFLVDDTSLAMRGIRKKMKKMKDRKKKPLASVTAAVQSAAAIVTKDPETPVTPEPVEEVAVAAVEKEIEIEQPVAKQEVTLTAVEEEVTETLEVVEAPETIEPEVVEPEIVVAANNNDSVIFTETVVSDAPTVPETTVVALADVPADDAGQQLTELTPVSTVMDTSASGDSDTNSLSLDIKFALNSDELTPSGVNALDTLGSALLGFQRDGDLPTIMLEGHTDDTGSEAYNLVLSEKRATSARKYLLERFSLPEDSVMSAGFGETAPKVLEQTAEGRRANRRVELRVIN